MSVNQDHIPQVARTHMDAGRQSSLLRLVVVSVLLISLMLSLGWGAAYLLVAARVEPPRRDISTLAPLVESTVVHARDVSERFLGYGSAAAIRAASLSAEVSSTVIERVGGIRAGTVVAEGQPLVRFDDRQYRFALVRAEAMSEAEQAALDELDVESRSLAALMRTADAELRVRRDEKARVAGLFEQQLAARKEFDFANLAFQQARRVLQGYQREVEKLVPRKARLGATKRAYEADSGTARLNIERCTIRAPFAGSIRTLQVDVGDRVGPGTVVVTLIDASRVEVAVELPGAVYDRVAVGNACTLRADSRAGVTWEGMVARIAAAVDTRTRTFAAYVVVDNTRQSVALVPGTFVRAELLGPLHAGGILVPRSACRGGRVLVADAGIVQVRSVVIDAYIEDQVLVRGDIYDGDRVILSHLDHLTDSAHVRVNEPTAGAHGPAASSHFPGGSSD